MGLTIYSNFVAESNFECMKFEIFFYKMQSNKFLSICNEQCHDSIIMIFLNHKAHTRNALIWKQPRMTFRNRISPLSKHIEHYLMHVKMTKVWWRYILGWVIFVVIHNGVKVVKNASTWTTKCHQATFPISLNMNRQFPSLVDNSLVSQDLIL